MVACCPRCQGFTFRERMGFSCLSWTRCLNCGWYGEFVGRDPDLSDELVALIREIDGRRVARRVASEGIKRAAPQPASRTRRSVLGHKLRRYKFL